MPPPCFRRSKIARKKPDLPVKGWNNCFSDENGSTTGEDCNTDSGNAGGMAYCTKYMIDTCCLFFIFKFDWSNIITNTFFLLLFVICRSYFNL